jgi:hypothetical protein
VSFSDPGNRDEPRVPIEYGRWLLGGLLVLAWVGFAWYQHGLASDRVYDCYGLLRYRIQEDICVRHAIEARDFVWTWAIGVPLALLIAAFAFRQIRR